MSVDPSDLPTRSSNGLAALDIFYSDFNDINFYVEDMEQENLYFEILRKVFDKVTISRIFPLGGKSAVFDHAKSSANSHITNFRVYIVDRDFDHFLGIQVEHPNVFYHDRFCIENYLLEPSAIIELVIECQPKIKRTVVEHRLSLDEKLSGFYAALRPLFSAFLLAQALDLGLANTSSPPEKFCNSTKLWELDATEVTEYEDQILDCARMRGIDADVLEDRRLVIADSTSGAEDCVIVSGKFVAAMLFHYLKRNYSLGSLTFESFIYRLAKNCQLISFLPFAERVRRQREMRKKTAEKSKRRE